MEAANLGARLADHPDDDLDSAITGLARRAVVRTRRHRLGARRDGGACPVRARTRLAGRADLVLRPRAAERVRRRTSRSTSATRSARTCCCGSAAPGSSSCRAPPAPCRRCSRRPARTTTPGRPTSRRWCSSGAGTGPTLPVWPLLQRLAAGPGDGGSRAPGRRRRRRARPPGRPSDDVTAATVACRCLPLRPPRTSPRSVRTIQRGAPGAGGYARLVRRAGEPHVVRTDLGVGAHGGRARPSYRTAGVRPAQRRARRGPPVTGPGRVGGPLRRPRRQHRSRARPVRGRAPAAGAAHRPGRRRDGAGDQRGEARPGHRPPAVVRAADRRQLRQLAAQRDPLEHRRPRRPSRSGPTPATSRATRA